MKSRNNEIGLAYHELSKHLNGSDNFVNLPKTSLPLRMSAAREMDIQEGFGFAGLYQWQKNRSSTIGRFCVHDGPPYANGEPHMGHFLNKTLKDVICRYKMMTGHRVHFVPGWDCHGLPVELKALTGVQNFRKLTPLNIREKARSIAEQQITRQKGAFKRWGVMADFENEFYCTFNHDYEANQISVFHQMYEKGCIYRGFKPIYWSPSSKTALAEAELEYKDLVR